MKNLLLTTALGLAMSIGAAQAMNRYEIIVINSSGKTITSVYAINKEKGRNIGDILPGTIGPGGNATVSFSDGSGVCIWSVKAETSDNDATPWKRLDICSTTTWEIEVNPN